MGEKEIGSNDNAVNLAELLQSLREQRWLIAKITGVFVVIGLLIALFSPVEYTSEALLMPDTENSQGPAGSLLKNYGNMLGLGNMGSMSTSQNGIISPTVYPKIVQSLTFQHHLLQQNIYFSDLDTTISGYGYFTGRRGMSLFGLFGSGDDISNAEATMNTPGWLRRQFEDDTVVSLTKEQLEIIKEMRSRIMIQLETETGVLTVRAQMPDPVAAAQVNRMVINRLKEFVKSYSTQKAKENLDFAELQYNQAQQRLESAQHNLAEFQDQNIDPSTARAQAQEQRLQTEFDLAYNMYNNVSQQMMAAKMKVQEQTPVFKPIQEVNVPTEKSEPKRLVILVISFLAGLIVSFLFIAGRNVYFSLKQKQYL